MRLFFAVHISDEVRRLVRSEIERIPIDHPPWRWIKPENYHITLKFLGEVEESMLNPLVEAASRAAAPLRPFYLSFDRFGAFPSLGRPRVLFFAAERGSKDLARLAGRIEEEIAPIGFEREKRKFSAHLTLARIRKRPHPKILEILESVPALPDSAGQTVDRFVLMRSTLRRSGAVYEELRSFTLNG